MNRDLKQARKKHLERGLQDKMSNSASVHKGVTEFLGWRDAGDPNALTSYTMVQRREEPESLLENKDMTDKVLSTGEDVPAYAQTKTCEAIHGRNDNHVLEGALPELEEGWKWVKQHVDAGRGREVWRATTAHLLGAEQA